jgi:hypothetical protein
MNSQKSGRALAAAASETTNLIMTRLKLHKTNMGRKKYCGSRNRA